MRYTYSYSIENDITNGSINIEVLDPEIKALILSTAEYIGISTVGDNLYIVFTEQLTGGEETALDAIILNHDPAAIANKSVAFPITPYQQTVSNTSYTEVARFMFPGSTHTGPVTGIDILSMCDSGANSYDVIFINISNNTQITSKNMDNTSSAIISFDTINNIPTELSEISVVCRVNRNGNAVKNAYIRHIILWVNPVQL